MKNFIFLVGIVFCISADAAVNEKSNVFFSCAINNGNLVITGDISKIQPGSVEGVTRSIGAHYIEQDGSKVDLSITSIGVPNVDGNQEFYFIGKNFKVAPRLIESFSLNPPDPQNITSYEIPSTVIYNQSEAATCLIGPYGLFILMGRM